jgi:hypothetical protein
MANKVFANNREVACETADGKSVCAFPDVCFTPPPPSGVPVPYPNTAFASDCTGGSRRVKISGGEVMLRNKSFFKRSTGDEAGCAPKKGALSGTIAGKVYFHAWSMTVRVEGENVPRHLDAVTHNHASAPGNTPVWPYLAATAGAAVIDAEDLFTSDEIAAPEPASAGAQSEAHTHDLSGMRRTPDVESSEKLRRSLESGSSTGGPAAF